MKRHEADALASLQGPARRAGGRLMGALLVAAGLAACGGGDEDGAGPPVDQGLSVGAASLAGDWLSRTCIAGTARSSRLRLRVVQAGDNAISYSQTFVHYANGSCAGAGTADARSTPLGSVTFSRSDASGSAAANWGLWVLPNGVHSGAVWGKKGRDSVLCIGATDRAFTGLNSLAAVSSWMNLSDASCHDRS